MQKSERSRKIAAQQKNFRRNLQPKGARRKNWIPEDLDLEHLDEWAGEEEEFGGRERIMPRDEGERRRALEKAVLTAPATRRGSKPDAAANGDAAGAAPTLMAGDSGPAFSPDVTVNGARGPRLDGLVVEFGSGLARVDTTEGVVLCSLRGALADQETGFTNAVAAGDQVRISLDGAGGGVIEHVLPRRTVLTRPDVFRTHLRQIVVANADQLLIVASWREPAIWYEFVDRYLIAAMRNQLPALLCVNKVDLAASPAEIEEGLAPYHRLGIPVLLTSAETGEGIPVLAEQLAGRSTVLAGLSGVGKSSLLGAVQPALNLRVSAVSLRKHEGRHTTTQATLYRLDETTSVVDTPGIREIGIAGLAASELAAFFPEMAGVGECRFRNCTHVGEPDCAVRTAARRGLIAATRYASYRKILGELAG
jgi:ribosome biogenesis GTPase